MHTKKNKLYFPIIAFLTLIIGCGKTAPKPCGGNYVPNKFRVASNWSIEKSVYFVGDTIFLNAEFNKSLVNYASGDNSVVNYGNASNIIGAIGISFLDTLNHKLVPARDSFGTISITGNFEELTSNQNTGVYSKYAELGNSYKFIGGLVCKKRGLYYLGVDELGCAGLIGKDCTNAIFTMTVTNLNKNEGLFSLALNMPPTELALSTMYCFRVQ